MARLLRLVLVCLIACALPLQGSAGMALRAAAAVGPAAADVPPCPFHARHRHAEAHPACGDCCGPAAAATPALAPVPTVPATRRAAARPAPRAAAPVFVTGGPDRPPRPAFD